VLKGKKANLKELSLEKARKNIQLQINDRAEVAQW
jgi:hypothetical protein